MIGLGALDSGELGLDFIEQTGTYSFPMYWDDTGESWVAMGISRQPAGILLAPDGTELGRWNGEPDLGDVLDIVNAS